MEQNKKKQINTYRPSLKILLSVNNKQTYFLSWPYKQFNARYVFRDAATVYAMVLQ